MVATMVTGVAARLVYSTSRGGRSLAEPFGSRHMRGGTPLSKHSLLDENRCIQPSAQNSRNPRVCHVRGLPLRKCLRCRS